MGVPVPAILLMLMLSRHEAFQLEDLIRNEKLVRIATELHSLAPSDSRSVEVAAFLVRREDRWDCLVWPATYDSASTAFRGTAPEGTVAILHTHPFGADENPSPGDILLAKGVRLPVYVLTTLNVTVASMDGSTLSLIRKRPWRSRGRQPATCHVIETANPQLRSSR